MKKVEAYTVDSNENINTHADMNYINAIELYKSFSWGKEQPDDAAVLPTVSFSSSPAGSHVEYINIYSYNSGKYALMIEAFSKTLFLGIIPRWKSIFLDLDSASQSVVDELIMKLFELPQDDLYRWLVNYQKTMKP